MRDFAERALGRLGEDRSQSPCIVGKQTIGGQLILLPESTLDDLELGESTEVSTLTDKWLVGRTVEVRQ